METKLRVVIADDERPARSFWLRCGEHSQTSGWLERRPPGQKLVELIERARSDLALLDLQMPELDGLDVVRLIRKDRLPLVAFVTAYDEYADRSRTFESCRDRVRNIHAANLP